MTDLSITKDEFALFRNFIESECGIALQEDKTYLIEARLTSLALESGCNSFGEFYLKAKSGINGLKDKIINAMTTNETLWFRDESPYKIMEECLLPALVDDLIQGKRQEIRIWSAACSSGQEPYSLSMTIAEYLRQKRYPESLGERIQILATDISTSILQLAKMGRYDAIAISRGLPEHLKDQYFEAQGRVYVIKDEVKRRVTFQPFNLKDPFSSLGSFDIVLLRNVAIYFSHDFKMDLFQKVANVLNPNGYLFLGASESLTGYTTDFLSQEHGRGLYYQMQRAKGE